MKTEQKHIILKQSFELEMLNKDGNDHHALLDEVSSFAQKKLPQILDKSLNEIVPANEYWQADKLELTLELDDISQLEAALNAQLSGLLKSKIEETVKRTSSSSLKSGQLSSNHYSTSKGPALWILYFLKTGTLIWSAPQGLDIKELEIELDKLIQKNDQFISVILRLCQKDKKALSRLVSYFDPIYLWQLLKRSKTTIAHQQRWQQLEKQYVSLKNKPVEVQMKFWQKEFSTEKQTELMDQSTESNKSEGNPLFIENAGLILLHPFLPRLLQNLNLATDNVVTDIDTAVNLIASLATGKTPETEWQLTLSKLLLGLPISTVIKPAKVNIDHLAMGEEMLQAVIKHWSALGNTSVEGLRGSFLLRPGKLQSTPDGWLIKLEQRAYDLLLDQLPWQLSHIKLPWMDKIIKLER